MEHIAIEPYLNPYYWNGHTLGVGDTSPRSEALGNARKDSRYARNIIHERVHSTAVTPIHTFQAGQTFDPSMYQPGTVVLMNHEALFGLTVELDYDLDELTQQAVPVRPTVTSPSFGPRSPLRGAKGETRLYLNGIKWAVVPRDNDAGYLSLVSARKVIQRGSGARVAGSFVNIPAPITIGETLHNAIPAGAPIEMLSRVNILHLIAYGKPEQQKQRAFSPLAKLALGGIR